MKRCLVLACLLLTVGILHGQSAKEEQKVINLSAAKYRWMVNLEFDSLQAVLHDRMVYIHSNGWSENKKELIDDLRSGKLIMKSVEVQSATAHLFNQTAIVNGQAKFVGEANGTAFSFDLLYSEGYIKENGKWLLISRLATKLVK
jgi:hypothetical protein